MRVINPLSALRRRETSVHKTRLQENRAELCEYMESVIRDSRRHRYKQ